MNILTDFRCGKSPKSHYQLADVDYSTNQITGPPTTHDSTKLLNTAKYTVHYILYIIYCILYSILYSIQYTI